MCGIVETGDVTLSDAPEPETEETRTLLPDIIPAETFDLVEDISGKLVTVFSSDRKRKISTVLYLGQMIPSRTECQDLLLAVDLTPGASPFYKWVCQEPIFTVSGFVTCSTIAPLLLFS